MARPREREDGLTAERRQQLRVLLDAVPADAGEGHPAFVALIAAYWALPYRVKEAHHAFAPVARVHGGWLVGDVAGCVATIRRLDEGAHT